MVNFKSTITVLICLLTSSAINAQSYQFSKPVKLKESINSSAEEINPRLTPQGDRLYFTRVFSSENIGGEKSGQDIWYSDYVNNNWTNPINLKELNNGDNNSVVGINEEANKLHLINNYTAHPRRLKGMVFSQFDSKKDKWGSIVVSSKHLFRK